MLDNGERRSILCPNCRRLISMDEPFCPNCGIRAPGARWRNNFVIRSLSSGDMTIRNITVVCIGMYILSILIHPGSTGIGFNPLSFLAPGPNSLLLLGETGRVPIDRYHRWWTVISATYLHGGILHILFNMMALRQIGPLILQEYGAYRMFTIFTLGGVCGYLASYMSGVPYTVGASASICGLIGAALYYGKNRGGAFGHMVYQQVMGWVVGLFLFGLLVPRIDNWAHGGGLLSGILLGMILGYHEKTPESSFHKLLAGICVLATVGTLLWAVGTTLLIVAAR